jgi:hypothetical protein
VREAQRLTSAACQASQLPTWRFAFDQTRHSVENGLVIVDDQDLHSLPYVSAIPSAQRTA